MHRVFVDANVLFSAAYDPTSRIAGLFQLQGIEVVTSRYAAAEALRNLDAKRPSQLVELIDLLRQLGLVEDVPAPPLPVGIDLPLDDRPILQAAIACRASHLVTGDK